VQVDVPGKPRRSKGVPGPISAGNPTKTGREIPSQTWVLEGGLAGAFGCHEIALEFVSGADFWCKLMCRASPGYLEGSRGRSSALAPEKPARQCPARLPSGTQETNPEPGTNLEPARLCRAGPGLVPKWFCVRSGRFRVAAELVPASGRRARIGIP